MAFSAACCMSSSPIPCFRADEWTSTEESYYITTTPQKSSARC
jgi:hypothetical protein